MKHLLIGILLALVAGVSFANGASQNCNGNGSCASNTTNNANGGAGGSASATGGKVENYNDVRNTNINTNRNEQGQAQSQKQGQAQGQGQSQSLGLKLNNGQTIAPAQSVVIESPRQAVPAAGVSAAGTTATCRVAGGASVGAVWGGFSFSGSVIDENCEAIELAKAAIWAGASTGDLSLIQGGTQILTDMLSERRTKAMKAEAKPSLASTTEVSFESFSN